MREVAAFLVSILSLKVTDKIENIGYFQSRAGTVRLVRFDLLLNGGIFSGATNNQIKNLTP